MRADMLHVQNVGCVDGKWKDGKGNLSPQEI